MKRIFYLLTIVMAVAGGSLTVRAQAVYPTAKTPTNSLQNWWQRIMWVMCMKRLR